MGQYDKYPVRNGYGHIEYLTAEEIANLKDRGEEVEVLDNQPSSKFPPWAKNPANQARVNELFYEEQKRKAEKRRKRGGRRGSGGRGNSRWTPGSGQNPDVGVVGGTDHVASFKTAGDETLIADGDYSRGDGTGAKAARDAFDAKHNHYGRKREGGGYFSEDRGHYTGPDH